MSIFTRTLRIRAERLVGVALCAALVAACSTVPGSGPSRSVVVDEGGHADAPYLLVPISDFSIQNLQHFPGPSLYGRFGDYRPAILQTVGVGDTIDVSVFEAAGGGLFSQPVSTSTSTGSHSAQIPSQIVQNDGSITVPYAGRVEVVGKTTPQIEQQIVQRLTGKAIEPQAIVSLSKNIASSVTVGGEVVKGARVPLSARGDRLLDVLAEAGGINAAPSESFLELTRSGRTTRVPFQTLLNSPKENIFARPDDVLTVIRYPLTFTAAGATSRNAVVPFDAVGISLEEAVGKASGVIDEPRRSRRRLHLPLRADRGGACLSRPDAGAGGARSRADGLFHQHARSAVAVPGAPVLDPRQGHPVRVELAVQRPAEAGRAGQHDHRTGDPGRRDRHLSQVVSFASRHAAAAPAGPRRPDRRITPGKALFSAAKRL